MASTGIAPVEPTTSCPFVMEPRIDGTPVAPVTNTPLLAVASPVTVLAPLEYKRLEAVYVSAKVEVEAM